MPDDSESAISGVSAKNLARYLIRAAILASCAAMLGFATPESALASIPDSNGVYHGCLKTGIKGQQTLYVIDTAVSTGCTLTYTAVTWTKGGLVGPAGAQGPAG